MSRHQTSKPWWGLNSMRERVLALRAAIEPELAKKRPVDLPNRPAIAAHRGKLAFNNREPGVTKYHPPRKGYHHKIK